MSSFFYKNEIKALNKSGIEYLVIGGIAVNLYGLARLTRDMDLMIDVSEKNLQKFALLMNKLGYGTKISIEESKDLVAIAFRHKSEEYKQIDIFIKNPIDFKKAFKRRKKMKIDNIIISCVGFDDLIKLKKIAGRDRDLIDLGYLKKFKRRSEL
jgi:predicted nucleotidyltransferase